jgi:Fe2+ transport system protein FeoA
VILSQAKTGDRLTVVQIPPGLVRAQLLRLGISEGCELTCVLTIPAGPVVVRQGNLDVALGRKTAAEVQVRFRDA